MKKKLKNNLKMIISIIVTAILVGGTTAFASYNYFAKNIEYEKKDGTKISVEEALNDLYKSGELEVITSATSSTTNNNNTQSSIILNIPQTLNCNNGILVVARSSFWWDSGFANNISGNFEKITKIYEKSNGYNSGSGNDSIQAGNAVGIYYIENMKAGGSIIVSGPAENNPQTQGVLLKVK